MKIAPPSRAERITSALEKPTQLFSGFFQLLFSEAYHCVITIVLSCTSCDFLHRVCIIDGSEYIISTYSIAPCCIQEQRGLKPPRCSSIPYRQVGYSARIPLHHLLPPPLIPALTPTSPLEAWCSSAKAPPPSSSSLSPRLPALPHLLLRLLG